MAIFFHSRALQGAAPIPRDRALNLAFVTMSPRRPGAFWETTVDGRLVRRWRSAPPPD